MINQNDLIHFNLFAGVAEPVEGERDGAAGVGGGGDVRLLRPRPRQGAILNSMTVGRVTQTER